MAKQAFYCIDDVIWCLRDITRQRPASIFDNGFFAMLKKTYVDYGMPVQLNLFYRTDFFYGDDEFSLAEVTDAYKAEFEASSSWLKFAFHAKQEFPDYPYVNVSYEDARKNFTDVKNEVIRFAGEKSFSNAVIVHWGAMSKAGCQALKDCGVKFISPRIGEKAEFNGDDSILPFGHAARLRQNKQPESMVLQGIAGNKKVVYSVCSYNSISNEQYDAVRGKNASVYDAETGLRFIHIVNSGYLNNILSSESLKETLTELKDREYVGIANHEQYFYPDYYAYQSDFAEKVYISADYLCKNGFEFITADDFQ